MNNNKTWAWVLGAVVVLVIIIMFVTRSSTPTTTSEQTTTSTGETADTGTQTSTGPELTASGAYVIRYYTSGFSPKNLIIAKGTSVHFINNSSQALRVTAVDQVNQPYAAFSSGVSIGAGGSYDALFSVVGSYTYYNMNDRNDSGNITVK